MWTEYLSYWDVALAALAVPVILAAAVFAWVTVAGWQRRARQRRLRVELFNQGNARTHYAVWVDNPAGQLAFRVIVDGRPQDLAPAISAAAPAAPRAPSASPVSGARVSALADWASTWLGEIGRLLPGQLGASVRALDHNLRQTDYTARRLKSMTSIAPPAAAAPAPPPAAVSAPLIAPAARAQTPAVEPGASLVLQLEVTPAAALAAPLRTFQLCSQALE
ncbi:MAG: hypothetical protein KA764_21755, partial [Anaerolineales bacterium]|nr:hypothetical protein [Anaerolineales bacterium]